MGRYVLYGTSTEATLKLRCVTLASIGVVDRIALIVEDGFQTSHAPD